MNIIDKLLENPLDTSFNIEPSIHGSMKDLKLLQRPKFFSVLFNIFLKSSVHGLFVMFF